jgi:hypothetical protein
LNFRWPLALVIALAIAGCGGGGSKASTPTAPPDGGATATGTTPSAAVPTPAVSPASERTPETLAEAQADIDRIVLKPADLPEGWTSMSDATQTNEQLAAANPTAAASNTRCGRLVGRTTTLQPADVVGTFISGGVVSYFSQVTIYATNAGAADCAAEAAQQVAQPAHLAKAFGNLFVDPNAVVVTPVQYPAVADGSFAATLAGKVNASGTVIDLTLLIVAFRKGNVTAVVGSAANEAPPTDGLKPYVDLVVQRIGASQ